MKLKVYSKRGISFQSFNPWALNACNFLIYVNIFEMTILKSVTQSYMFDFGSQVVPNKGSLYFFISSFNYFENDVINVKYTLLDSALLQIIIFLSSVIFHILHKFETFCILVMLFTNFFATFDYKKNVHLRFL